MKQLLLIINATSHFSATQHNFTHVDMFSTSPTSVKLPDFNPPRNVTPVFIRVVEHWSLLAGCSGAISDAKIQVPRDFFFNVNKLHNVQADKYQLKVCNIPSFHLVVQSLE